MTLQTLNSVPPWALHLVISAVFGLVSATFLSSALSGAGSFSSYRPLCLLAVGAALSLVAAMALLVSAVEEFVR